MQSRSIRTTKLGLCDGRRKRVLAIHIAGISDRRKSTLAVTSLTNANTANGSTVHADSRAITFDANGRLIVTSDGTIYARTNPQNDTGVWTRLSGNISAFESSTVAYDAVGKRLTTAAQDNGVTIQSARNSPLWNAVMGADGINVFRQRRDACSQRAGACSTQILKILDYLSNHPRRAGQLRQPEYVGLGFGAKVTCNGIECADAVAGANVDGGFFSPWVNNRVDPTRMAFGGTTSTSLRTR